MKNFRVMLLLIFLFDTAGVFFITKRNGNIDVWDLMDRSVSTSIFVIHVTMSILHGGLVCRSHEPALAQNISSMAITSIHPWPLTCKQTTPS